MPLINIHTIKGALDEEKKNLIYQGIADLMVKIEGNGNEALRPYVITTITEEGPENFSIGGKAATKDFTGKVT